MKLGKYISLFVLGGVLLTSCKEKPIEEKRSESFIKFFGTSGLDIANDVKLTPEGGFILAGFSQPIGGDKDAYLVKTDEDGNLLWERTFGGSTDEVITCIDITSDGSYIVGGYIDAGTDRDIYIARIGSDSSLQWSYSYTAAGNQVANDIIATNDGGYALAGYTDENGTLDAYVIKYSALGSVEWEQYYGGDLAPTEEDDWATSIIEKPNGGYIVGATSESYVLPPSFTQRNYMVIEINAIGGIVDRLTFGNNSKNQDLYVAFDQNGDYRFAGTNYNTAETNSELFVFTSSSTNIHAILDSATIVIDGEQICKGMTVDSEGNTLITGKMFVGTVNGVEQEYSTMFVKRTSSGTELYTSIGGETTQVGNGIVETPDGRIAIGGGTDENSASGMMVLMKVSKEGELNQQ